MTLSLPIGIDDFRAVRELGLMYVDKSHLICELLDRPGAHVVLLPRPRRFGKTLNLSMLRYFFERRAEDLSALFAGLRVWEAGEPYRAHFQRYPILYITLKGVKHETFAECIDELERAYQASIGAVGSADRAYRRGSALRRRRGARP
jgi:predicted AAA-ATPase